MKSQITKRTQVQKRIYTEAVFKIGVTAKYNPIL